jgi:DNA repair exonuclease SbcCD ATPase subunit
MLEKSIVDLRDKWHEVNAWESQSKANETCPTCGQNLPPEKVQETKERLLAEFNTTKALTLEQINEEGKAKKSELEKTLLAIKDLEKEIAELESRLDLLAEDNAKLNGDLAKTKANFEDYKEQTDYKKLLAEKDKLQKVLAGDREGIEPEKERIEAEIETIKKVEADLLEAKANLALHKQGEKRINELEAQQGVLAEEFEKLEEELYLIDLFIRTKVTLLTERINSKFKFARFKLFEEQINGGISEVCETTYNGVPYSSGLNNAARINVGLDIINTLSEHHNFAPPVFIDNAEAVTELIPVEGQLISLIVNGKDKTLRIEGQGQEQATLFEEAI